jgi:polyvinyl alcohol dehydrogenase (cytochrome)
MRRYSFALTIFGVLAAAASTRADGAIQLPTCDTDDGQWTEFNHDLSGTRNNRLENTLSKSNVSGLKIKWQIPAAGPVNGTPAVADGKVYVGDGSGLLYAITTAGSIIWKTQLQGPVTASVTVVGPLLTVGDLSGNIYGVRRDTGAVVWTTKPDSHPLATIFGSAVRLGTFVAYGISSNEEAATQDPNYHCCSFRGSVVLLNSLNGKVLWKTYTISDADYANGASGAGVWSTPTFDVLSGTLFVTTGNNYSQPATTTSDGFIALDALTGAIKWTHQLVPNDTWNYRYPYTPGSTVDADFGDSPQVYTLRNGRRVVGAGSKSGFYHVLDARTGALVNQIQLEPGGTLGGLFADSGISGNVVFTNGTNWPGNGPSDGTPPVGGDVVAISSDGSSELWRFSTPGSPNLGAVAIANGVVYFGSGFAGNLYALDASTGAQLAAVPYGLGVSGPAVAGGQVYIGGGLNFGTVSAPGSIVAFGL